MASKKNADTTEAADGGGCASMDHLEFAPASASTPTTASVARASKPSAAAKANQSEPPEYSLSMPPPPAETRQVQMTCDVLCSLSSASTAPPTAASSKIPPPPPPAFLSRATSTDSVQTATSTSTASSKRCTGGSKAMCSKQHQLPMFLTKTYHMIDRCDSDIATWSDTGDNFVVKNVEKFAGNVLPLYFKHSNFSSFARQLNFYGFRKLRTDPILTTDVDPRTSCYVRFYHEKFQKDRPELLHHIKRATKSDPHTTKDDMDTLKTEVNKYHQTLQLVTQDFDRKLHIMREEYNQKLMSLSSEYERLTALVQQLLAHYQVTQQQLAAHAAVANAAVAAGAAAAPHNNSGTVNNTSTSTEQAQGAPAPSVPVPAPADVLPLLLPPATGSPDVSSIGIPNLLSRLSQVASMSLQHAATPPLGFAGQPVSSTGIENNPTTSAAPSGTKRSAEPGAEVTQQPAESKQRLSPQNTDEGNPAGTASKP